MILFFFDAAVIGLGDYEFILCIWEELIQLYVSSKGDSPEDEGKSSKGKEIEARVETIYFT